jgi:hypothetical protein
VRCERSDREEGRGGEEVERRGLAARLLGTDFHLLLLHSNELISPSHVVLDEGFD